MGELWSEFPNGDLDLAWTRANPKECQVCEVRLFSNVSMVRAKFEVEHMDCLVNTRDGDQYKLF